MVIFHLSEIRVISLGLCDCQPCTLRRCPPSKSWMCAVCTLENNITSKVCEMCGHTKQTKSISAVVPLRTLAQPHRCFNTHFTLTLSLFLSPSSSEVYSNPLKYVKPTPRYLTPPPSLDMVAHQTPAPPCQARTPCMCEPRCDTPATLTFLLCAPAQKIQSIVARF